MKGFKDSASSAFQECTNVLGKVATDANTIYNKSVDDFLEWSHPKTQNLHRTFQTLGAKKEISISKLQMRCAVYCFTVASCVWACDTIIGHGKISYAVMFASGAILMNPFCKKVEDFKEAHPFEFYAQWSLTSAFMCLSHKAVYSTTLAFVENFLRLKGETTAVLIFASTALAIGYFLMSETQQVEESCCNKPAPEAAPAQGGAAEPNAATAEPKAENATAQMDESKTPPSTPVQPKKRPMAAATEPAKLRRRARANSFDSPLAKPEVSKRLDFFENDDAAEALPKAPNTQPRPSRKPTKVTFADDLTSSTNKPKKGTPLMCRVEQAAIEKIWGSFNEYFKIEANQPTAPAAAR